MRVRTVWAILQLKRQSLSPQGVLHQRSCRRSVRRRHGKAVWSAVRGSADEWDWIGDIGRRSVGSAGTGGPRWNRQFNYLCFYEPSQISLAASNRTKSDYFHGRLICINLCVGGRIWRLHINFIRGSFCFGWCGDRVHRCCGPGGFWTHDGRDPGNYGSEPHGWTVKCTLANLLINHQILNESTSK